MYELEGTISNVAFASGDRFVIGHWERSPIGPMDDVMWARPDGTRVLLVDRPEAERFITAVYRFDAVTVTEICCTARHNTVEVSAGMVELTLRTGRHIPIPLARLRRLTVFRPVEAALARLLLGVRTYGVSPTGVHEWYRADGYRRVLSAQGWVDGRPLGALVRFEPAGFGFSEPPRRPAVVRVKPRLDDPDGRIREALEGPWHSGAR